MNKIAIIGSGGSGKSTLAIRLGRGLDLPVYHLDALYWNRGWVATESEKWEQKQRELCAESGWVMDGNYGGTMDVRLSACDTVIFLDLPRMLCLYRVIRRAWRYRNRTRLDMAEGCPERIQGEFLRWIWNYPKVRRPVILEKLNQLRYSKTVVVLSSRRAIKRFLESVEKKQETRN